MGLQSVIYGYIQCPLEAMTENVHVLESFSFDVGYPFTDIFWAGSPSQYFSGIIGINGSFKQIEDDWDLWLTRLCDLLYLLDAYDAKVHLRSIMGTHFWTLVPEGIYRDRTSNPHPTQTSFRGERWGILNSSENDFLPDMAKWVRRPLQTVHRWPVSDHRSLAKARPYLEWFEKQGGAIVDEVKLTDLTDDEANAIVDFALKSDRTGRGIPVSAEFATTLLTRLQVAAPVNDCDFLVAYRSVP